MTIALAHEDEVNDFLAHHGVLGMHWGNRKGPQAGGGAGRSGGGRSGGAAAPRQTWGQRRVAKGQAILDRSNGSTKRAIGHIAGKYAAAHILTYAAGMAASKIPDANLRRGAIAAAGTAGGLYQLKLMNDTVKVAQAHHANKVAGQALAQRKMNIK